MQMAQKQVLAPRMIQSMEILQLPIMALQERIEQEMEDNPVLDQIEPTDEFGSSTKRSKSTPMPRPNRNANWSSDDDTNNEDDFERLLNMADNLPDDYEERSRPSRGQIEAESDRRHDAMANMVARPESLLEYLRPPAQLVRSRGAAATDVRADHLQPRQQRLSEVAAGGTDRLPPRPSSNGDAETWQAEQMQLAEEALADRPAPRSARRRCAQPEGMPAAATHAGPACSTKNCRCLIEQPPGRPGKQPTCR